MVTGKDTGSSSSVMRTRLLGFANLPVQIAAAETPAEAAAAAATTGASRAAVMPRWLHWGMRSEERGLCLIQLLWNCAAVTAAGRMEAVNAALEHISVLASPDGNPMQRLGSVLGEALARRALRAWPGVWNALLLPGGAFNGPTGAEVAAARRGFNELCEFLRLAGTAVNQVVLEALESEMVVHVIDLGGADHTQWLELLALLAARPEGPPHLRLTVVHDHLDYITESAGLLIREAERLDIPFQLHTFASRMEDLHLSYLHVKPGEALAVVSTLQLHCLPTTAVDANSTFTAVAATNSRKRKGTEPAAAPNLDSFLRALKALSPKVVVMVEQEACHTSPSLPERFMEALNYYAALFDALEVTKVKNSPPEKRACVERWLLGEELRDIISRDGAERRELHEKMVRWAWRMEAAGFDGVPMGYYGMLQVRRMLQGLGAGTKYMVREDNGWLYVRWEGRDMFSVSAWRTQKPASG